MENIKSNNSKRNIKFYFTTAVLLFLIMALSMAGVTEALFTDSSVRIDNTFKFGTVLIDAVPDNNSLETTSFGDNIVKEYTVTSFGSKSVLLRAFFDGYWDKIFHANTATVTAEFNSQTVTDHDQAHFVYLNSPQVVNGGADSYLGFTDRNYFFSSIAFTGSPDNATGSNNNDQDGSGSSEHDLTQGGTSNAATCDPADQTTWDGPLVDPITETEVEADGLDYFVDGPGPDPNPYKLPYPDNCTERHYFKINLDETDTEDGKEYTIADDDVESSDNTEAFKVTIYKSDGNEKFAFSSNLQVYHVYAKGGTEGGNLYRYYYPEDDPAYPNGVTRDCNLSQPPTGGQDGTGSGWSHIVFYYCAPPDDPSIDLKKMVSVDGGNEWLDAGESPGPALQDGIAPQFKFIITNTGNVPLTNIQLSDDVIDLGVDSDIPDLDPGQSHEIIIEYTEWDEPLSTENITIKLCPDMDKWQPQGSQPLGTYFYHTEVLKKNDTVTICVELDFSAVENGYESGEFVLYSYFEAIQKSNDMIKENWPEEYWWLAD